MKFNIFTVKIYIFLLYIFAIYIFYENYKRNLIYFQDEYFNFLKIKYLPEVFDIIREKITNKTYIQENHMINVTIGNRKEYFVTAFYHMIVNDSAHLKNFLNTLNWKLYLENCNSIKELLDQIEENYFQHIVVLEKKYVEKLYLTHNVLEIKQTIKLNLLQNIKNNIREIDDVLSINYIVNNIIDNLDWYSYVQTIDFCLNNSNFLNKVILEELDMHFDPLSKFLQDFSTLITIFGIGFAFYYSIIPSILLSTILRDKSFSLVEEVLRHFKNHEVFTGITETQFLEICKGCHICLKHYYIPLDRLLMTPEEFMYDISNEMLQIQYCVYEDITYNMFFVLILLFYYFIVLGIMRIIYNYLYIFCNLH